MQSIAEEVGQGSQTSSGAWGRNYEALLVACYLLVHSHVHAQTTSLPSPGPSAQGMVPPIAGWALPHQFRPSKQCLTHVSTGQPDRGKYSTEALFRWFWAVSSWQLMLTRKHSKPCRLLSPCGVRNGRGWQLGDRWYSSICSFLPHDWLWVEKLMVNWKLGKSERRGHGREPSMEGKPPENLLSGARAT